MTGGRAAWVVAAALCGALAGCGGTTSRAEACAAHRASLDPPPGGDPIEWDRRGEEAGRKALSLAKGGDSKADRELGQAMVDYQVEAQRRRRTAGGSPAMRQRIADLERRIADGCA